MNHRELELCAGQQGRIVCRITAPEDTDITLKGAVTYVDADSKAQVLAMECTGNIVTFGTLPVGRWVYEIRCGGRTLLYGHIRVYQSPLAPQDGIVIWQIDAEDDAERWVITLTELGGADGKSAYQLALESGFEGTLAEWLESLRGGVSNVELTGAQHNLLSDSTAKSEGEWQGLHIPSSLMPSWRVTSVCIPVMLSAQSTPLWLAAYEVNASGANTLLEVSAAAVSWEAGEAVCWDFPGGLSIADGNNLSLLLVSDPSDAAATSCNVYSGHVKSYYVGTGVCQVRYANVWYGNRTPELIMLHSGHVGTMASADTPGHVCLAAGLDDTRPAAVPSAAMVREMIGSGSAEAIPTEQLLSPSVGMDSLASGTGAAAYCANSLAIGFGAVVGATYSSQSKTATATRQSTTDASTANDSSNLYSSNGLAVGLHAQVSACNGVALGNFATASGFFSTATGSRAQALGSCSTATGSWSRAWGDSSTATGNSTSAYGDGATAMGYDSEARGDRSIALGFGVRALGRGSIAIGAGCYVADSGVVALNVGGCDWNDSTDADYSNGMSTQFYLIGSGTNLANSYTDGEAGLGFVVLDHLSGSIVARGCCKLSSLCTMHTSDFTPTNCGNIYNY